MMREEGSGMIGRMDHDPWRERALILPAAGAIMGLLFHLIAARGSSFDLNGEPARLAVGTFIVVSGVAFALTAERLRWHWSLAFAATAGAVAGLIFYWSGGPGGYASDGWQFVSILIAIAIAAPLFQSARDEGRASFGYAAVHSYAWSNVVLWFASLAFVGATLLLVMLLGELFHLIGIDLVRDLMRKGWFGWMLVGSAIGAAAAMLRDRDRIMDLLQGLVMTILSVLAVPLAIGLALFVLALPFTGLQPLWDQTQATTPILLACMIGAVLLANSVIRNAAGEESQSRILRISALVLALVQLPLAFVALASTWQRIGQYGFTPERLWGVVFVGVSLLVASAYALSVLLGRREWMPTVRANNVRLAMAICAIALLLATPLLDFGAISTRDQIARLNNGRISKDRFDWAALAFDFGPSGRKALERLAASGSEKAKAALGAKARWDLTGPFGRDVIAEDRLLKKLVVKPAQVEVPAGLRAALIGQARLSSGVCVGDTECLLLWRPGEHTAIAVQDDCPPDGPKPAPPAGCGFRATTLIEVGGEWQDTAMASTIVTTRPVDLEAQRRGAARGQIEVRNVSRRQLFIGGEPFGQPFE